MRACEGFATDSSDSFRRLSAQRNFNRRGDSRDACTMRRTFFRDDRQTNRRYSAIKTFVLSPTTQLLACPRPPYLQMKLEASSVLPLPLYDAVCEYGHSGRV